MKIKQFRTKRPARSWAKHLMCMRKLYGPTSVEQRLKRFPVSKGNKPPQGVIYYVPHAAGQWRSQELLVDLMYVRMNKGE